MLSTRRALIPTIVLAAGLAGAEDQPANQAPEAERIIVQGATEADLAGSTSGTADRLGLSRQQTPQSVSVLDRELLDARGATTLREALRSAPGVTMAAGEGGRTGDSLSIRGFAANSDLYLDGIKDNGQYFRDTFATERIEVLRGAAGVLFGRGSTGGAVNTVTRKPGERFEAEATLGVDSFGRVRAVGGAGGPLAGSGIGGRIDAVYQDGGSFRDEQELTRSGVAGAVSFPLGGRTRLLVQGLHQEDEGTMDYGVPMYAGRPADVPVETYYGFKDDSFQEYDVNQFTATITHDVGDGVELRNATRLAAYDRYYRTETLGAVNYTTNVVARAQALRQNEQRNLTNQTELAWKGTLGDRAANLLVGLEYTRETYDFRGKNSTGVASVAVFAPDGPDTVGAGRANDLDGTLNARNETDATTIAGYAHAAVDVVPRVTAVAGVRVERFTADYSNGPTTTPTVTELSSEDTMVSPRAGLVWTPKDELSFYASWSRSYNPSAETFSLSDATADLDPERTDNYEVGAKATMLDGGLTLGAAAFRLDKSKARTPDPTNTALTVLDGEQRTDGIELEAVGTIGAWTLQAGIALFDAEVVSSNATTTTWDGQTVRVEGKRPVNAPDSSGSLWLGYELGHGFDLGAGLYATSARYTDQANSTVAPGYVRFDAALGWQHGRWLARLNVLNLADTVHWETGSARSAYAGTPLAGELTVGVRF